ncbi:hypothetical protein LOC54_11525 [Acetobacter sp. AN02]|nr:hypothetical protein [Acetobacter sp. AN02]MDG6095704.1 hypothetical protein [Acetobacter sp. AN02]
MAALIRASVVSVRRASLRDGMAVFPACPADPVGHVAGEEIVVMARAG